VASSAATPNRQAGDDHHVSVLPSPRMIDHMARSVPERPELDNRRAATCANDACLSRTESAARILLPDSQTAFAVAVGVASGSFLVATYQRYRERVLKPVARAVSEGLATCVVRPVKRQARTWLRWGVPLPKAAISSAASQRAPAGDARSLTP
jgi:hypothetical protein